MKRLLGILQELHPDVDFSRETRLADRGILDSFDIVTLVAEIRAVYGAVLRAEDLLPEHFNSAEAIFALILRTLEQPEAET